MAIKSNNYFRVVGGKELGIGDGVLVSGSQGEKIEKKKKDTPRGEKIMNLELFLIVIKLIRDMKRQGVDSGNVVLHFFFPQ